MCGIVGVYTNKTLLSPQERNVFTNMLHLDYIRGVDSTGVAGITDDGVVRTHKDIYDPGILCREKKYQDIVSKSCCLIGHNRAATHGGISKENAHPFTHGHVTLVHNGTLWGRPTEKHFAVDSEAIAYSIYKKGINYTVEHMSGAATIVWWDNRAKTLNMWRDGQRPLWRAVENQVLYYASEPWMIEVAYKRIFDKDIKPSVFPDEMLWEFFIQPKDEERTYIVWTKGKQTQATRTVSVRELWQKKTPLAKPAYVASSYLKNWTGIWGNKPLLPAVIPDLQKEDVQDMMQCHCCNDWFPGEDLTVCNFGGVDGATCADCMQWVGELVGNPMTMN